MLSHQLHAALFLGSQPGLIANLVLHHLHTFIHLKCTELNNYTQGKLLHYLFIAIQLCIYFETIIGDL